VNDRQPHGALVTYDAVEPAEIDRQDVTIQEQQGARGLVLGGRGDLALVVEDDVAADPGDVGFFSPSAVVTGAERGTDAVE
jgi:hypothetical protein